MAEALHPPVSTSRSTTPVQSVLSGVVATVAVDASLREVARKLMAIEAGALVVGSTDAVHGVISERDIVRLLGLGRDLDAVRAGEAASRDVVYCSPTATLDELAELMSERGVRHVLVGGPQRLAGIVSVRDVLAAQRRST